MWHLNLESKSRADLSPDLTKLGAIRFVAYRDNEQPRRTAVLEMPLPGA